MSNLSQVMAPQVSVSAGSAKLRLDEAIIKNAKSDNLQIAVDVQRKKLLILNV
jgi:hypothetical protein